MQAKRLLVGLQAVRFAVVCFKFIRRKATSQSRWSVSGIPTCLEPIWLPFFTGLFSDATANPDILRRVLGEEVVDITPRKAIRHQKRVLQFRSTSREPRNPRHFSN